MSELSYVDYNGELLEIVDSVARENITNLQNIQQNTEQSLGAHLNDTENPHGTDKAQIGLGNVDNTTDINKPVSLAQRAAIDDAYYNSNLYTDEKIAALINGAPTTLDTLKEIADAMAENDDVVSALEEAVGKKANEAEFNSHVTDKNNPHDTTAEKIGALPKDGNAVSATKAIQDANGNVIADTYQKKTGDSANNTVSFTNADSANPTAWTDVLALTSGEKHSSLFNKISTMFKNVRWLYKMLGTADISTVGGGTVTGAISTINNILGNLGGMLTHSGQVSCIGSQGGGTGETNFIVENMENGVYVAVTTVEAWVSEGTVVQLSSSAIATNNTWIKAYQSSRNTLQHVGIANITNGTYTIYLFHDDYSTSARTFNVKIALVRIK